jgi:hypothetical protein
MLSKGLKRGILSNEDPQTQHSFRVRMARETMTPSHNRDSGVGANDKRGRKDKKGAKDNGGASPCESLETFDERTVCDGEDFDGEFRSTNNPMQYAGTLSKASADKAAL